MKRVQRAQSYYDDLIAIEAHISAQGSPQAAADLWLEIDDQVAKLSDPNHPRRRGLIVPGAIVCESKFETTAMVNVRLCV